MPTRAWTDIWEAQHDSAFVVAGAMRDELLDDLRGAVTSAIEDGTTLAQFRQEFDDIVARHGWQYNGGRDWRTRVIYDTNLRTSYAAGRWAQLQAVKSRRPYWRYRHSHASENPRLHHLGWDGLVLSADDPWWQTNFPPNGWGCKCYIDALSERDLKRLGKDGPDKAPALNWREVTVGERGPSPRTVSVPEHVDPGFAYAPGSGSMPGRAAQLRLQQGITQEPQLAGAGVRRMLDNPDVMAAHETAWRDWRSQAAVPGGQAETFVLGALDRGTQAWLASNKDLVTASAAITITKRELSHVGRGDKAARRQALNEADWDRLPSIMHRPDAVLWDRDKQNMLYVFAAADDNRSGKVVVEVNYSSKMAVQGRKREQITTNSVRTAGYVQPGNLREPRYELIRGEI